MAWSAKYKASIDCEHPKGFSQRAHCAGRLKKMRRNPELDYASLPIVIAEAMIIHGNNLPLEAWKNIYASIGGVGDPVEDVRNMNYDFIERVTKIQENLINEAYLPPIPPRTLRITHSTGLRLANYGEEIVDLVKGILKHGLAPQAEGSGRYSELPTAVFALVDYPPNTKDNRLYNVHHPW